MLFGQTANPNPLNDSTVTVADKIIITGTVTNENGVGISAAVKYFFNEEYIIIKTGDQGQFEFKMPSELVGKILPFNSMRWVINLNMSQQWILKQSVIDTSFI